MSRAEEADIRTGVLGLDPRTHLASFLAVGVAAMLVTGLLETALLQAIAAAYLAANGRPKLARQGGRELRCGLWLELFAPVGPLRRPLRERPPYGAALHGRLRALHALSVRNHVRARPLARFPGGARRGLHGVPIRVDPLLRGPLDSPRHQDEGNLPPRHRCREASRLGVRVHLHAARLCDPFGCRASSPPRRS